MTHRIAQLINTLPEQEKSILVLRFHEGLTIKEIGLVLNLPIREVAKMFALVIAGLRKQLGNHE